MSLDLFPAVILTLSLSAVPLLAAAAALAPVAPVPAMAGEKMLPDSSLKLIFRNYAGGQVIDDVSTRHAWMQSVQAYFDTGYSPGPLGLGLSVAPFAAIKLDSSARPGNMVVEQDSRFSAFLGEYTLNARLGGTRLRYGLQRVSNPFLESKDNRSLPPMFRGLSVTSELSDSVALDAGSFNAVQRRGEPRLQDMMTAYGGVRLDRLDYVGTTVKFGADAKASVYSSRANGLWRQHYLGISDSIGPTSGVKWGGAVDAYMTRDEGAARQGKIDNKAYSGTVSAQHGATTLAVAYQRNVGDQWFDYINDTWGNYLSNSSAEDYNTPHERSLQLRYEYDGARDALPGVRFKCWGMKGWGSDATASSVLHAAPDSLLHELYWRRGQVASGGHMEVGFLAAYVMQSGSLKGGRFSLLVTSNNNDALYANAGSKEYNFKFEMPVKVF